MLYQDRGRGDSAFCLEKEILKFNTSPPIAVRIGNKILLSQKRDIPSGSKIESLPDGEPQLSVRIIVNAIRSPQKRNPTN